MTRNSRPNPLGPSMLLVRECAEFMRMSEPEFRRMYIDGRRLKVHKPSPRKTLIHPRDFDEMLRKCSVGSVWAPPEVKKRRAS